MKHPITLGVVCLGRHTFDTEAAADRYRQVQQALQQLEAVEIECVPELVIEVQDAKAAAERLTRRGVDGLVCISGTFHLGHLVLELHKALRKPCLLWAWNEPPYDGGKIRLNSVCGLNLNASNLYKAGVRDFAYTIGDDIDTDWLDALRVAKCLSEARVGLAGYRAHGFFNESFYEPATYGQLGTLVDHFELEEIWGLEVSPQSIDAERAKVTSTFGCSGVTEEQVNKVAALAARLRRFVERERLSALAIRCWPEMAARYGISPCASMSLLQAEGVILGCEGDVEGVLSMLAQRAVGGETPYLFDLSQVSLEDDHALLWHCGVAPANLWDGQAPRTLDTYFAGGKGVTADFVLRPGRVSILRLDSVAGELRVFLQQGTGVSMDKELKGTYLKVRFDKHVREVLADLLDNGVAHHASMVYADAIKPFQILARMRGWKVIGA